MSWSLVTVTYNSRDYLERHWASFREWHSSVDWIVVDNASLDDSAGLAASLGARVVRLPRNAGFSFANNVGLSHVRSSHVLFVNPDIEVPEGTDFAPLERWKEALVAPALLNEDGSIQDSARGLPYLTRKVRNRLGRRVGAHRDYVRQGPTCPTRVAWVMGAALGGETATLRSIGAWNEDYFVYYEDHEIGLRAWQRGLEVIYDPNVRLVHEWQRATKSFRLSPWTLEVRSMLTFYRAFPGLLAPGFRLPDGLSRVRNMQWRPVE